MGLCWRRRYAAPSCLRRPRLKMEAVSHAREQEVVKEGLIDHSGMYKHVLGRLHCLPVQLPLPPPVDWSSSQPGGSRAGIVFALLARRSAS